LTKYEFSKHLPGRSEKIKDIVSQDSRLLGEDLKFGSSNSRHIYNFLESNFKVVPKTYE
jgi:hypothetical protein